MHHAHECLLKGTLTMCSFHERKSFVKVRAHTGRRHELYSCRARPRTMDQVVLRENKCTKCTRGHVCVRLAKGEMDRRRHTYIYIYIYIY